MATSNRLSTNSRSSQRTDNAGMLNRLALYHDRLKTEQARLEKLEDKFRELKKEITARDVRKELEQYLADKIEKEVIEQNFDGCDEEDQILEALRIASDMKEARAKIRKTEGKIEEFESGGGEEGESIWHFSGSVWESLKFPLPSISQHVLPTVSSTAVISDNYKFAPASVIEVSMERFMNHCIDEGFVSNLQEEATSLNVDLLLRHSMQSLFLRSESSIGLCFSQVFQAVTSVLPVEEGDVQLGYTSDFPVKLENKILKPDFVVGTITQDQAQWFGVSLVGELKGLGSSADAFSGRWCNKDVNHDECIDSERHHPVSPIRQLYNYMVQSGKFVGVYSNYMFTAAFFRDCEGNLATTPMLPGESCMRQYGLSIPQFLALVTMIALKGEVPQFLDDRGNGILVSCTGLGGCKRGRPGRSLPHTDLPENCEWDRNELHTQNRGGGGGDRGGVTGAQRNNLLYKEHDTPITWDDLYNCKYISDCYTGNAVECEIMGERAVVKYNDFGDHEDADERLDQIDFEAEVYANLSDLQGDCIPKYLGHGSITDTDGSQYGFATSYAGESLSYEYLDSLTEEFKTSVKDALDKIHARGVLHGDLRLPNILKSKDDPKKAVFIDFSHSGIYDDPDGQFFQVRARLEKENLVKLLKGEKIKQVL